MALTDNKTKIQQLIAGINALPDAGSGGGGVETCTVVINTLDLGGINVAYTAVDSNGDLCVNYSVFNAATSQTFENVAIGTCLLIESTAYVLAYSTTGNVSFISNGNVGSYCTIAFAAGEGTITVRNDV